MQRIGLKLKELRPKASFEKPFKTSYTYGKINLS